MKKNPKLFCRTIVLEISVRGHKNTLYVEKKLSRVNS
jgi:hypothetical protein